jgi:hypothetical protein
VIVPSRKKGRVIFCGATVEESGVSSDSIADRRLVKRWKEAIWHWRMRMRPPSDRVEAALWREYKERARYA